MPTPQEFFVEAYRSLEERLDEVQRVGEELVGEALLALSPSKEEAEKKKRAFTAYASLVSWSFRKQRRFLDFLSKLYSQPVLARLIGAETVSFVVRSGGQSYVRSFRYTAYDAIEFMTAYTLASTKEGREKVFKAVLSAFESGRFNVGGKLVDFDEYLKHIGVSREEFERALREYLDEAMDAYLKEIESTRGSRLAKHIWLRNLAKEDPETPHFWLAIVSQSVSLSLVNMHATSVILKKVKAKDEEGKTILRAAREIYREFTRFERRITSVGEAFLVAADKAEQARTGRRLKRMKGTPIFTGNEEEALKRIREIREMVMSHPATTLAMAGVMDKVLEIHTPHILGESPAKELGARARAKKRASEQEEVKLDELMNTG